MLKFTTQGLSLNYVDVNPHASQILFFIHGNSHSLKTFKNQMDAEIFKDYRMIFVDLPGHGDSDKLKKYSLTKMAVALSHFVNDLKIKNIMLIGHSLGGHIAINILDLIKPKALFIFGTPPLDNPFDPKSFLPNSNAGALHKSTPDDQEINTLMKEMNYKDFSILEHISDFKKTDTRFRSEILIDIINGEHLNEIKSLESFVGQVSILLARQDSLINNSYIENILTLRKFEMNEIDAGHSPHVEMPEAFNNILYNFIRKVF